ncbi:MAG: lecithin retinol acyltransferase family protein [Fretibacterium sp.]|nr:lecithin retinol acyltransferase family protein [Fretibacterium sp.]
MPRSLAEKLLAGAWAVLMSRQADRQGGLRAEEAENGDVIKVNRGTYDHYGIYVSDGPHVIHYTGATGPADFNGRVRETSLEEFLNGAKRFTVCRFPQTPDGLNPLLLPNRPTANGKSSPLWLAWQEIKKSKLKDYHLYSGAETVARARSKLGKEGYSIAGNNCEHFAVWCRTGLKESSQVNKAVEILLDLCG